MLRSSTRASGPPRGPVTTTGYGEDLAKAAFHATTAWWRPWPHFTAARTSANVDFIIDIGGQDMKCFKIDRGHQQQLPDEPAPPAAAASFRPCPGSGYDVKEFASWDFAERPWTWAAGARVHELLRQAAQKDGPPLRISPRPVISVVKNAIYKVIRASSPEDWPELVSRGTFYNEAVLRAFEKEMGGGHSPGHRRPQGRLGAHVRPGQGRRRSDQLLLDRQALADFHRTTAARSAAAAATTAS